jgi:myo-inositol-1(or 4)-monophosphatase
VGAVYNPVAHKCFWAEKNGGAYLNDKPIHITSTNTLNNSLLVTGFPYIHDDNFEKSFELFKELYGATQGIRRLGAAALDFCFVAMGRFEGFWEFGLHPWDVCAGAIILQEAGGKVSDWDGSPMPFSGKRVLATNGHVHGEMMNTLGKELL